MRRNANIISSETTIEPQPALIADDLPRAIHDAAIRELTCFRIFLLLLEPRLDEVERERQETGEEAGDGRRREGLIPNRETSMSLELGLGFREERQLADIERHRSHNGREGARPQGSDAFSLGDAGQRVNHGFIVRALLRRLQPIGLHPDQRQVGRVADHSCDAAGGETRAGALVEGDFAV